MKEENLFLTAEEAIDRFTERVMLWYNEQTETTTDSNEQEGKAA